MRGRSCPKAWVFPVPERVCSKVLAASSKRLASRAGTRKSRHASKNLPALRRESLREGNRRPVGRTHSGWLDHEANATMSFASTSAMEDARAGGNETLGSSPRVPWPHAVGKQGASMSLQSTDAAIVDHLIQQIPGFPTTQKGRERRITFDPQGLGVAVGSVLPQAHPGPRRTGAVLSVKEACPVLPQAHPGP